MAQLEENQSIYTFHARLSNEMKGVIDNEAKSYN